MDFSAIDAPSSSTQNAVQNGEDFPELPKGKARPKLNHVAPYKGLSKEVVELEFLNRSQPVDESANLRKIAGYRNACKRIANNCGVNITIKTLRVGILTLVISGETNMVAEAKVKINLELQQISKSIRIPTEYFGFVIGRKGDRLQELEFSTMTKITIPSAKSKKSEIVITGPSCGVYEAEKKINESVLIYSETEFERIKIPHKFFSFIRGPNNEFIDDLKMRTGTKISIPPSSALSDEITISGKSQGVREAVKEIQTIYQDCLANNKCINIKIKRTQHRFIRGRRDAYLSEILKETGVSVELSLDENSDEVILYGKPVNLGRAISMIYERVEKYAIVELNASQYLHKFIIGKGGSRLTELLEGYPNIQIEFKEESGQILVEGPKEEVEIVIQRLNNRLTELKLTIAKDSIEVDPKYYRHIIGKNGATIGRLCEQKVQITLPKSDSNVIVIEGDPSGVERAKFEIQQLVEKLENEKSVNITIEPRAQRLLCSSINGTIPPIRTLYDLFPKVSVIWPEIDGRHANDDERKSHLVQLRGDGRQIDEAAKKLDELVKKVIKENYCQEIKIFRSSLVARDSKARKLIEENHTRLQFPNLGEESTVYTVIGCEENVRYVIGQLEEMQKDLANVKQVVISVPSKITTKITNGQAPTLRSISEQCEGVHIRFLNSHSKHANATACKSNQDDVVLLGPKDKVDKAQKLIEELNSRITQLVEEDVVVAHPRYHGYLIGRNGVNITEFRQRNKVELIFPDRFVNDKSANEIRIIGPKGTVAAAKCELESIIKSLEDEVEQEIPICSSLVKDFVQYRRSFPNPDLERFRILIPKVQFGRNRNSFPLESVNIKLIGSKANMEIGIKILESIIENIKNRITKEFPLNDANQMRALDRQRVHLSDIGKCYNVYLHLDRSVKNENDAGLLTITGTKEQIEDAFENGIKPLLPIEESFSLAQEFHRQLIAQPYNSATNQQRSATVKGRQKTPVANDSNGTELVSKSTEIRRKYFVHITLPPQNQLDANFVILRGVPDAIAQAKLELVEWVRQCEQAKADYIARNFRLSVTFPLRFLHAVLNSKADLQKKYQVILRRSPSAVRPTVDQIPVNGVQPMVNGTSHSVSGDGDEQSVFVNSQDQAHSAAEETCEFILIGYEDMVNKAKIEIDALLVSLASKVTESLHVPMETHSYLIGSKGNAIQKVSKQFKVDVEFPNRRLIDADPNTVLVTGDPEDVDRACDYIVSKANELLANIEGEKHGTRSHTYTETIF